MVTIIICYIHLQIVKSRETKSYVITKDKYYGRTRHYPRGYLNVHNLLVWALKFIGFSDDWLSNSNEDILYHSYTLSENNNKRYWLVVQEIMQERNLTGLDHVCSEAGKEQVS